jgi:hypothetical protein
MRNRVSAIWWGFGGAIWGLFTALGSVVVGGAGHGWVSAWPFGLLAILTTPLTTIAWARRMTNGKHLAAIALVVALLSDVLLFIATLNEGTGYFLRVLSGAMLWMVAWISWQVLALVVLFYRSGSNFT